MVIFSPRFRITLTPDPGSVRSLLAGAPIDAGLLGRRGDSSQVRHGGKEILSLGTRMGLLMTLPGARRPEAPILPLKEISSLRKNYFLTVIPWVLQLPISSEVLQRSRELAPVCSFTGRPWAVFHGR
jgi:hypothetical protein